MTEKDSNNSNNSKDEVEVQKNFNELLKEKMAEIEKEYRKEKQQLTAQIKKLKKMLSDLEAEKEAERKKLENDIIGLKNLLQQYARAYQELEQEFNRLISPPLAYGYAVSVINPTARTAEVISQDGGRYRIFVAKSVDLSKLKRGQPVLLNQALHIIDLGLKEVRGHLAIVRQIEGEYAVIGRDVGGETTALISEGLKLEPGDQVIVDRAYTVILAKIEKREQHSELLVKDVELISSNDIGGLDDQIETLKQAVIRPLRHPEWYKEFRRKPPRGILLVGAPGCGKTLTVKWLYNYLKDNSLELFGAKKDVALFHVGGPELQIWWVGMTEYFIRNLFKSARKEADEGKISIIFLDEAESMLSVRRFSPTGQDYKNDYVTQFCAEMDGFETNPDQIVIIILASNRGELIDPAVIRAGRVNIKIEIPRPNKEAATDILGKYILPDFTFDQKYFQGFTDKTGVEIKFQTKEEVRDYLIKSATEYLFTDEKFALIKFSLKDGGSKTLYFRDVLSGAIIRSIVEKAVDIIMEKREQIGDSSVGMNLEILKEAMDAKFNEEKILIEKLINEGEWKSVLAVLGIKGTDVVDIDWLGGKRVDTDYGMMS